MKIEDSSQFAKQNLRLKNERDRVIAQKKLEIDRIKKNYDQQTSDARYIGREKLDAVRDENQAAIIESLDNKEARLNEIKKSLEETQNQFKRQEHFSKDQYASNLGSIRENYQEQLDYIHQKAREDLADTTTNINQLTRDIKYENQNTLMEATADAKNHANEIASRNDQFIAGINKQYANQVKNIVGDNKYEVKQLEREQRREMSKAKSDHFHKLSQTQAFQSNEVKTQKSQYEETVKTQKDNFEKRYAGLQKEHNGLMAKLKSKIDEELNSLKDYYTKAKEKITQKSSDSFYNITKIEPSIKSDEKFYYFTLPVPKHEESTVNINAQERDITVTQNRRFDQRVEEGSSVFKSKRSESLIKQFKVDDILDGTKVARTYDPEAELLTYRIARR